MQSWDHVNETIFIFLYQVFTLGHGSLGDIHVYHYDQFLLVIWYSVLTREREKLEHAITCFFLLHVHTIF